MLGHVSLLLDIQLSADQHYLATCDRDEKIRISQYPLAHQIQSYCLGHREFVTSCAFIDSDRLVSSSGDGSVACWHFRTGRLAFQRQVTDDLSSRSGDSSPTNSRMVVNRIYRLNDALVIACVSAPAQMLLYLLTDNAFEFKHQLAFDSDIIDSTQHGSQVYVITRRSGIHLVEAHNFELQLRFISINLNEHEAGTAIVEKLAAIDVQSNFDQFFKVPFEANIEQYYENKKKRIKAKEGC